MTNQFTIVIIKPNNFDINSFSIDFNPLYTTKQQFFPQDKLYNLINDYVSIDTVTDENMMDKIVQHINIENGENGDTKTCGQTFDTIYQLCCIDKQNGDINKLASILTKDQEVIFGTAIFLSTRTPIDNYDIYNVSADINDIYQVIVDKLIHYGIQIDANNNIKQIIFNNSLLIMDDRMINMHDLDDNIVPLFKYDLMIYNDKLLDINLYGMMLTNKKINGTIYIISRTSENTFDDIDIETVKKMLTIVSYDNSLTNEEQKVEKDQYERYVIKSKYRTLYNRFKNHKSICGGCNKQESDNLLYCSNCCRTKYCSIECQKKDWKNHRKMCLKI